MMSAGSANDAHQKSVSLTPEGPPLAQRRQLRRIATAYLVGTALAVVLSRPLLFASGAAYLFLMLALGPIGFLFNLWIYPEAVIVKHVAIYLAATALLAVCLFLMKSRLRVIRNSAFFAASLVWVGSSAFTFWVEVVWGP